MYAGKYIYMYKSHNTNDIVNGTIFMLVWDRWNEDQHDLFVHVMQVLHLLGQDDWNEVHHEFFSHFMLLALAAVSCDGNGIVNCSITSIASRWLRQIAPLHPLHQDDWDKV